MIRPRPFLAMAALLALALAAQADDVPRPRYVLHANAPTQIGTSALGQGHPFRATIEVGNAAAAASFHASVQSAIAIDIVIREESGEPLAVLRAGPGAARDFEFAPGGAARDLVFEATSRSRAESTILVTFEPR
jgi:hypothetical protein